jgi:nucleotide-binding universal stress UspA family protein
VTWVGLERDSVQEAERYLERVAAEVRGAGVQPQTLVLFGDPAERLLHEAEAGQADLIVLATQKTDLQRLVLGSVATQLVQRSPLPVIVLRPGHRRVTSVARILVPLDGSLESARVLPVVAGLARTLGAELLLQRVISSSPHGPADASTLELDAYLWSVREQAHAELEQVCQSLARAQVQVRATVWTGPPAAAILRAADLEQADLIAMATHGRRGLGKALLGSIADEVVHHAQVPVLTVSLAAVREPAGA